MNSLHKILESFFVKKDDNIGDLLWYGITTIRKRINDTISDDEVQDRLYSLLRTMLKLYVRVYVLKRPPSDEDVVDVMKVINDYTELVRTRIVNERSRWDHLVQDFEQRLNAPVQKDLFE